MKTLEECLKLLGKTFSRDEKMELRASANRYLYSEGMSDFPAAQKAILEKIVDFEGEATRLEKLVEKETGVKAPEKVEPTPVEEKFEGPVVHPTFMPGKSPAIWKDNKETFLKAVDEAIKKAPEEMLQEDLETIQFVDQDGTKFNIYNRKEELVLFKKEYSRGAKPPSKPLPPRKPIKPSMPGPAAAKKETLDSLIRIKGKKGWFSDGHVLIKGKPPAKAKYLTEEEGKEVEWKGIQETLDSHVKNAQPAELRYYGLEDPNTGEVVSKEPIAKIAEENYFPVVVFKAGDERKIFNQYLFRAIANRYPDATYKFDPSEEGKGLVAFDKGKPVGLLMPMRRDMLPAEEMAKTAGFYDTGGYATQLKSVIEMPEIVEISKQLMQGKYPRVVKYIRAMGGQALGIFYPRGKGEIKLKAEIFKDADQAAAVLSHEIGHLVDYLPERTMARGNLLGRIASLKKYMKHTLPEKKGAPGALTTTERDYIRRIAEKLAKADADEWIDEIIRKELPINPQDVLNIWNAVEDAKLINPDLYEFVARLNTAEKKSIVKDALRGQVSAHLKQFAKVVEEVTGKKIKAPLYDEVIDPKTGKKKKVPTKRLKSLIAKKYAKLINDEIARRRLFHLDEVVNELKSLTRAWKPFDPSADPKITKYRYSGVELYADAISALINAPGVLKSHAPKFYEGFFNYLESKPELKKLYESIQDDIKSGKTEVDRVKRVFKMFRDGDDAYALSLEKGKHGLKDGLMREMIDAHHVMISKIRKLNESLIPAGENPRYKLEELVYSGAEAEWLVLDVWANMIKPLEKAGLTWDEFGFQLFLERISIGDRETLANSQGWTPKIAKEKLEEFKRGRSDDRNKAMDEAVKNFRTMTDYIIQKGKDAGRWSPELIKMMEENSAYATFDVIKYVKERHGAGPSAKIFPQIGTLSEITNPATATILKNIAIVKAINRQIAAESVVDFLHKHYPKEITPADTRWNGKFQEIKKPDDPQLGLIAYLESGKAKGFYVDRWVADIFDRNPWEASALGKLLSVTIQPFRMAFTELNYGFWMFNIHRDFFRALSTLPEANLPRFLPHYLKGIKEGFKSVYGIPSSIVGEMQRKKSLISVADFRGQESGDKEIERLLKRYHMIPQTWDNKIWKPFGLFFTYWTNIGRGFERATKVGAYSYLKKRFPEMPDEVLHHIVRVRGGSPDFLRRGRAYPIYNNLMMFSNAMKEGYKGDYEAFAEKPGAFMYRKAKYIYLPKFLMYGASIGLLGAGIKAIMDGASEYDKTNYAIIPLGLTESGKSVYLRIPVDETGRFMGGILWKALKHDKKKLLTGLADYMAGQAPTLHPGISALGDIITYASGKNPYDYFRGRYALPEQIQKAGGERRRTAFIKWMINKSGGTLVYRFKYDDVDRVKTELEKVTGYPFLTNIVGRFLKVSNRGLREMIDEDKIEIQQLNTRDILDAKDALHKWVRGEPLDAEDMQAILKKPDLIERNLLVSLSRKYGHLFLEEYLTAISKEEKVAVLKRFFERMELLKEAQND